jgi:outer membrane receptor for ferrienterochelin and colicin
MHGYRQIIHEATGITRADDLEEIEDVMRQHIFHSTLDWQTREQLSAAAIEAWGIIQYLRSPEGCAMMT